MMKQNLNNTKQCIRINLLSGEHTDAVPSVPAAGELVGIVSGGFLEALTQDGNRHFSNRHFS